MNNIITFALTILILSLSYTPTYSIRNSLNAYQDDTEYNPNPEVIIYHDIDPMQQPESPEIRSIEKYDPNDFDHDVIHEHNDDEIQDPNLVAPPGPIDDNDDDEEDDVDGEFADPSSDQGYSSWIDTQSKYISILNFCIIGLAIIFISCVIYWCYRCGGFDRCPRLCSCLCCKKDKGIEILYDEDGSYRYINSKGKEIDNEEYMSHDNENDGTIHEPLLSGTDNEFKYQSFDLLSDV